MQPIDALSFVLRGPRTDVRIMMRWQAATRIMLDDYLRLRPELAALLESDGAFTEPSPLGGLPIGERLD